MKLKIYFIIFFFILIIFQAKKLITNIQTSDTFNIFYNNILSNEFNSSIKNFINTELKNQKPSILFKKLVEKYPLIESVVINRTNFDVLNIKLTSSKPLCIINNDLVFAENKRLFEKKLFNKECINDINNIKIKENISPEFLEFVHSIPKYLLNSFDITWSNKNIIHLKDKDQNFTILISNNIPRESVLAACKKIKSESLYDKKKEFIADLRFSNQLIISQC